MEIKVTKSMIDIACMSYNHAFGILPETRAEAELEGYKVEKFLTTSSKESIRAVVQPIVEEVVRIINKDLAAYYDKDLAAYYAEVAEDRAQWVKDIEQLNLARSELCKMKDLVIQLTVKLLNNRSL